MMLWVCYLCTKERDDCTGEPPVCALCRRAYFPEAGPATDCTCDACTGGKGITLANGSRVRSNCRLADNVVVRVADYEKFADAQRHRTVTVAPVKSENVSVTVRWRTPDFVCPPPARRWWNDV